MARSIWFKQKKNFAIQGRLQSCGPFEDLRSQGVDFAEYARELISDTNALPTIESDSVSVSLLRHKLGVEHYGSDESLSKPTPMSMLEYKVGIFWGKKSRVSVIPEEK